MSATTQHYSGQAPGDRDRRIPSLDGLRAISIALVLLAHASLTPGFPHWMRDAIAPFGLGNLGVRVFFVISGFLITGLLVREHATKGRISLRSFYLRRTFRIFPAYYAYLFCVLVAAALRWLPPVPPKALLHALTYTVNYTDIGTWMTAHFWSLSVEEQFYLLWPPILVWLGIRGGFRAATAFVLLSPVVRILLYQFVPSWHDVMGTSFESVGDAIATGCLLSYWRDGLWARGWYRRLLSSGWVVLIPLAVVALTVLDGRPRFSFALGIPMKNIGIAIMLDWSVRFPASRVGRFLNAPAVAFVGVLSYSLYVWQQLFIVHDFGSRWLRFPLNLGWAFLAALLSYHLVEQPALRLRARIERRRAPARPPIAENVEAGRMQA